MARPQKYTPERAALLCQLLEIGVTRVFSRRLPKRAITRPRSAG